MSLPFAFLQCVGKALAKGVGDAASFGGLRDAAGACVEDVWDQWGRNQSDEQRRADLEAVAGATPEECRRQAAEIVREVAAGRPEDVRRALQEYLNRLPAQIRRNLQPPADPTGSTVPQVRAPRQAADLVRFLVVPPTRPAAVTLHVIRGELQGQEFVFDERTTSIIGRADGCQPRLPDDEHHKTISRHHCLLDVNPPDVRVRDFGSLNGTFINRQKIGQRARGQTPEEGAKTAFPEHDVKDGDEIELGDTVFRVRIFTPTLCGGCSAEIPEEQKAEAERAPGVFQCAECCWKTRWPTSIEPPKKVRSCRICGRDVSGEAGANRAGEFVCRACKDNPSRIANELLSLAQTGCDAVRPLQDYELLRELGKGGMGAVYLVRHRRTGEEAALKVMLPEVAADQRATEMFLREIENTRAVNHPHVVRLRDFGCSHGVFFFTLDYCDGGSADRLRKERGGKLPADEAGAIVLQALAGLEYAHQAEVPRIKRADGSFGPGRGLVHRDLKPHNLFLCGAGNSRIAKVGDFGLAKAFDAAGLSGQTWTGARAGTPAFMPRQQVIYFKYARPDVDVWAAAASLYALLTGNVPRDFPRGRDPWQAVLQSDAVPIRRREPSIPPKLAEVIDLALIDRPAIHFQTAAELRQALESVL